MFRIFESATRVPAVCAAVLVGLVFTGVGRGAPNPTCTVQVVAGQSIQDAIDGAATGATVCVGPGTYQENLLINRDGITLKGAGPEDTVLEPPTQPRPFCLFYKSRRLAVRTSASMASVSPTSTPRVRCFGQ